MKFYKRTGSGLDPVDSACREAKVAMLDVHSELYSRLRAFYCGDQSSGVPPALLFDLQSGTGLNRALRWAGLAKQLASPCGPGQAGHGNQACWAGQPAEPAEPAAC